MKQTAAKFDSGIKRPLNGGDRSRLLATPEYAIARANATKTLIVQFSPTCAAPSTALTHAPQIVMNNLAVNILAESGIVLLQLVNCLLIGHTASRILEERLTYICV
jgi:hypothetical protein